jgi:hypothetical protein
MSEAKSSEDQAKRAAAYAGVALFALVLTVACATFTLTYHGLYGYGHDVTRLGRFAVVIPIGVDGLALVGIAASFVLAHAPFRVRAYAWAVFAIGSLASIAGQLADAQARGLRWQGWVGSAFWPVGLALAAHLAVVTWRWRSRMQVPAATLVTVTSKPRSAASDNIPASASPAPPAGPPAQKRPALPSGGRQGGTKEAVRARYAAGVGLAEILLAWSGDGKPSKRTLELWTRDLRDQHKTSRGSSPSVVSGGGVGQVSDPTVMSGVSGGVRAPVNGAERPTPPVAAGT